MSYISVSRFTHMSESRHVTHVTVLHHPRVTGLIHMRDMTQSYAGHDSFICVT